MMARLGEQERDEMDSAEETQDLRAIVIAHRYLAAHQCIVVCGMRSQADCLAVLSRAAFRNTG
jgi:hypothetical protein